MCGTAVPGCVSMGSSKEQWENTSTAATYLTFRKEPFDYVLHSREKLKDRIEYSRQNPVRRELLKVPEGVPLAVD